MSAVPFKFGEVVSGKHFTNRREEIYKLHNNFSAQQNTIIISPRRYGKSSLVKVAADRFLKKEKGYAFCFLDLMYIFSAEEFYNQFATKIFQATSNRIEEFLQLAKNVIRGARVTINSGSGEPSLELGLNYINENIDTILELPLIISKRKKTKIIICIDEFQNISRFDRNKKLQGRLRSIWQHHEDVGYLFYGSKRTMMMEIFEKTNSPFYRFGEVIYLNKIKTEHLRQYVQRNFRSTGKEISVEICNDIINAVENHPYYLQQFARNVWLVAGKKVKEDDFNVALKALKNENQNFYNEMLDDLTNYQVSFLRALLNGETQLYSGEVIQSYKLGSSANVKRMYNSFLEKGIILKEDNSFIFADPVFKLIAEEIFAPKTT